MRRMRTIPQAATWAKEIDPMTALTQTAIRRLVLTGAIPHVQVGVKRLVALEDLEASWSMGRARQPPEPVEYGLWR